MRPEHKDDYADGDEHWTHVHDYLLAPAIEAAGYSVIAPKVTGAILIHAEIIQNLNDCDLVVADFSRLNPNVLFEAGIRTAINKPLVIVAEAGTILPFDTQGVNTWPYTPALEPWTLKPELAGLTAHITDTNLSGNALWGKFGVQLRSGELVADTTAEDARLQVLTDGMATLSAEVRRLGSNLQAGYRAVGPGRVTEESAGSLVQRSTLGGTLSTDFEGLVALRADVVARLVKDIASGDPGSGPTRRDRQALGIAVSDLEILLSAAPKLRTEHVQDLVNLAKIVIEQSGRAFEETSSGTAPQSSDQSEPTVE